MADTTNITTKPEAQAVREILEQYHEAKTLTILDGLDGEIDRSAQVLLLPRGIEAHSVKKYLDEYLQAPERRTGRAHLATLESFIAHANRFKDANSALFADPDPSAPSLTSVLNYHEESAGNPTASPRFGDHRGVYAFPLSDEWKAWRARDKKDVMDQAAFAEFIENRIVDVLDPATAGATAAEYTKLIGSSFASPSKLLELSRGLSLRIGAKLSNSQNLGTGETAFTFVSQHQDETGQPLKVPGAFLIAIPVFRGGARYQIPVRLRYRVRDGGVGWFYELSRLDAVFNDAFTEACTKAQAETGLPLFAGSPE